MATGQKKPRDPSDRIARRLLAEGRITQELHDAAVRQRQAKGIRIEEAIIEIGVAEEQLLRLLAEMYRVQYITTAKLSTAALDKRTLALVPSTIAEQRQVLPVLLDRQRSVLSVVTADPDDIETFKELELATQVKTVKALVARPAAVAAGIAKFYHGDDFAFSMLRSESFDVARALDRDPFTHLRPATEQHLIDRGMVPPRPEVDARPNMAPAQYSGLPAPPPYFAAAPSISTVPGKRAAPEPPLVDPAALAVTSGLPPAFGAATLKPARPETERRPARPVERPGVLSAPPRQVAAAEPMRALTPPPSPGTTTDDSLLPAALTSPASSEPPPLRSLPPPSRFLGSGVAGAPSELPPKPGAPSKLDVIGDPFQLAVVMVSLFEGNRKDLRGHSIQTARLVRKVCEKFNVPASRARAAEIAALFHDVGKASSYHLTPYNVARFDGHHAAAQKLYTTPCRVVESVRLAKAAVAAITHMYERYDGKGFPDGLKGAEIPLESRVLAICDSYTDLTNNPRNSFRKVLSAQEACEAFREMTGTVFDPKVVDRFSRVVLGDEIAQRLRGELGMVLLADPDVQETTVLELALLEKRYDVYVVRSVEDAVHFVESTNVDVVVSEMTLDQGTGFDLLERLHALRGDALPVVFLSEETDSAKVAEALEAGATDYLFKPLASQVVIAKIKRLLEQNQGARAARGVSGSLQEMSIPDIVQILHQGRKSGVLQLASSGHEGAVYFRDGSIVDASWRSLRGEEAFYALVGVAEGAFHIEPGVVTTEETVRASPEMLLLEGMRRLDEAKR